MKTDQVTIVNDPQNKRDILKWKIVIVGDVGVGKTSMINRYVHDTFSYHYKSTIGVDFANKSLKLSNSINIKLNFWEVGGPERYGQLTQIYYRGALGIFVLFDVTRISTYEGVKKWVVDLDNKLPKNDGSIPKILIASKMDLSDNIIKEKDLDQFCKDYGFVTWFSISSCNNVNIGEAVNALVEEIKINKFKKCWYVYWAFKNNMNEDLILCNDVYCHILRMLLFFLKN